MAAFSAATAMWASIDRLRWVGKFEADALDDDVQAADLMQEYEAKITALVHMVAWHVMEIELLKGALRHARQPKSGTIFAVTGSVASRSARDANCWACRVRPSTTLWSRSRRTTFWFGSARSATSSSATATGMSVRFRALLGSYCGILQCNGYAAHKSLADLAARCEPSVLAFCWSHVSRDFNIRAKGSAAPIATEALCSATISVSGARQLS